VPRRIQEIRVTFTWFERLAALWRQNAPVAMKFLSDQAAFAAQFDAARAQDGQGEALTLPWLANSPNDHHWFWTYYLRPHSPLGLTGGDAFQMFVPLRSGFDGKITCDMPWVKTTQDAFYYPHGIGLVVTVKISLDQNPWKPAGISLESAVQKAIESWSLYEYEMQWNGGTQKGKLDRVAGELLKHIRERVLAPGSAPGAGDPTPFSIAAVVRGSFDHDDEDLATEGGDLHRAIQGLCTLRSSWQQDNLYALKDGVLRIRRSAPVGHLVYHSGRGRALWFPTCFAEKKANRKIGCYQRNMTLLHLQTTSLIELLRLQAELAAAGGKAPGILTTRAGEAAKQLSDIYASLETTYRSSSPRAFINENPQTKALIEKVLGKKLSYEETVT
jgi:hypothetical protein